MPADVNVFYQTMHAIPHGHVTSYGRVAQLCGVHVRQVQAWLRTLPDRSSLPWYRIINSQRRITEHAGAVEQYRRLAEEGCLPDERGRFPIDRWWPDCLDRPNL